MANTLTPEVKAIILASLMDDRTLQIQGELDRPVYEAVDSVLKVCGGKWNKSQNCHVFDRGTEILKTALATDTLPPKNPLAFFPTPLVVAKRAIEFMNVNPDHKTLEPSAGHGMFCKLLREEGVTDLDVIEYDPFNCVVLREEGFQPHQIDFMDWKPDYQYDAVVMNPPFSVKGDPIAYITHFLHAYDMWNMEGNFVAIVPPTQIPQWALGNTNNRGAREFSTNPKIERFQRIIEEQGHVHHNEKNAFRSSGTDVDTVTICVYG